MDAKLIGQKLLSVIDTDALSDIVIDDIILASLKKVVDDSANKFDDAGYAMLAPLLAAQAKEELAKLIAKLKA